MTVAIEINTDSGSGRLVLADLPRDQTLKLAVMDLWARRYLSAHGWSTQRKIFREVSAPEGTATLDLPEAAVRDLRPGTRLVIDDIFLNLRYEAIWPHPVVAPVVAPEPIPTLEPHRPITGAPDPAPVDDTPPAELATPALPAAASRVRPITVGAAAFVAGVLLAYGVLHLQSRAPDPAKSAGDGKPAGGTTTVAVTPAPAPASTTTTIVSAAPSAQDDKAERELVQLGERITELQMQLATVRAERDQTVNVIHSKDKQISELRGALAAAQQTAAIPPQQSAPAPSPDNTAEINRLSQENQKLKLDTASQSKTISDWAVDLSTKNTRIRELETQLALASQTKPTSPDNSAQRATIDQLTQENTELKAQVLMQSKTMVTERIASESTIRDLRSSLANAEAAQNASSATRARWLAAAVDHKGSVQAISNQTSAEAAEKLALKLCGGAAGGCQLIGSYQSACFSVSRRDGTGVTRSNWGFGVAGMWQAAEDRAMKECANFTGGSCSIHYTICSPDSLDKP